MMTRDAILQEIYRAIRRANELREADEQLSCEEGAPLYGEGGKLDSLGLVSLVLDVEEAINAITGVHLVLADERSVSQRRSPFRDVRSLADHVMERHRESDPCANNL